jgi:SPP1 gp7 family putative phage head morphogenesis protein
MPRQLSDLEKQAFIQLLKNEKKYQSKVQKALADTLTTIRGEMSKIYSKYAKNGLLTRAEMTKYNKYQTMEKQILKVLEPAIAKNIADIKKLLPEQYNESFFHYAWAMDQAVGVNLNYGVLNQNMINELFSITNPKNIELANALKNYGPNAKKYLRNALLRNLSIGKSYASMIKDIRTGLNKTYNEAIRLIRTEGQRALNKGQNDLYLKAKNAGVEGVDVWDATLDGRTRASHQRMDGVKRNEDGYFEPIHARYPLDENLPAEESINCRCRLRFEIEGYSPQLRRTREQGIIPYQTYDEWEKNYGPTIHK